MSIFKTPYEIVGDGIAIAEAFYRTIDEADTKRWELVERFGAEGLRPGWRGSIRSLFFKEGPDGFRKIGREQGLIECVPHKGTKIGKEAARVLADAAKAPNERELADLFGWGGRQPIERGMIFFAVATRLSLPATRYLLQLPRQEGDGFEPPATLREMRQSEYLAAFEAHNDAARAER